jgi:hypothetical protein
LRSTTFVDLEVINELEKINGKGNGEDLFPEHSFIASCLRIGLTLQDLKILNYVDVMKILLSYIGSGNKSKKATQSDIDRLLG